MFTDYREMLKEKDIEMVTIAAPNSLHAQMTRDCAAAGKHIVCEKPLAMTIAEGEEMIAAAKRHGVLLMYGEELVFTPKYLKAKEMADAGAFGEIYLVKQSEKHFGPHSEWFWDVNRSGGGAFMDLGCHGIAFCYWFLGRSAIKSIYCQMGTYVHADKTQAEDDSLCILEFANGATALIENSWARRGGMDDRIEVYGDAGVTYANLHMGNALPTYSENGYGYAVEKAPTTKGWTYPVFEELWNYGTPQELTHFARCARGKETPRITGEDGLVGDARSVCGLRLRRRRTKDSDAIPGTRRQKADRFVAEWPTRRPDIATNIAPAESYKHEPSKFTDRCPLTCPSQTEFASAS